MKNKCPVSETKKQDKISIVIWLVPFLIVNSDGRRADMKISVDLDYAGVILACPMGGIMLKYLMTRLFIRSVRVKQT